MFEFPFECLGWCFPVLAGACQFGTAWAGLRLNPFTQVPEMRRLFARRVLKCRRGTSLAPRPLPALHAHARTRDPRAPPPRVRYYRRAAASASHYSLGGGGVQRATCGATSTPASAETARPIADQSSSPQPRAAADV